MTPSPTSARSVVAAFEGCEASSALLSSLVAEGWTVEALCVDAGQDLPPDLSERATALGASRVRVLERRQQTFERRLRWLIAANALHGGADPLWWLAERYAWPEAMAEAARSSEATAIAWTCPDPEESALWRRLLQRGGG